MTAQALTPATFDATEVVNLNARTAAEVPGILAELERRSKTAKDIVVPTAGMRFEAMPIGLKAPEGLLDTFVTLDAGLGARSAYRLSRTAHAQTAEKLGIPAAYYGRMRAEAPDLLAANLNTWATRSAGNGMLRTLDGRVRAHLSDKFRALDCYDLAFTTLKTIRDLDVQVDITRATLTDDRFEMRVIVPGWEEEIEYKKAAAGGGHNRVVPGLDGSSRLIPGMYVSNSDTGKGGLNIKPFIYDLVCTNGMVGETAFSRVHLGARQEQGYLSAETRVAKDATIWLEVADLMRAVFDRDKFRALIEAIGETASQALSDPIEAVGTIVRENGLTDDDRQAILNELISPSDDRDPGRTVLGLISAITSHAKSFQDTDPERSTDLEEMAYALVKTGKALTLKAA